ncbi:MAG: hypothetical protein C0483_23955 [Pirellula sp.]|nr:hypothetical protein [Pirellula sp.]
MNSHTLTEEVQSVVGRLRRRALVKSLALLWLGALAVFAIGFVVPPWSSRFELAVFGLGLVTIASAVAMVVLRRPIGLRATAQHIEQAYPDLETKLLAGLDQEQRAPFGRRGFLEEAVVQQARVHGLTHGMWLETVPRAELRRWSFAQWAGLALVLVCFGLQLARLPKVEQTIAAADEPKPAEVAAAEKFAVDVEPGDVELERGTDLLVLARFAANAKMPREATLSVVDAAGSRRLPLSQSLSDPIFAGRVPEVRQDLKYRLGFGANETREFQVTVFDYPELDRADAEIEYPSYTNLPVRRIEDVRQLTLVEGSELKLLCKLNKPVASARLVPGEGEPLELAVDSKDPALYIASRRLTESVRWKLELTDDRGRKNRRGVEFVVDVAPNRPPELKLLFPRNDVGVSPLQELPLEAQAADDFGVLRWGLSYELTGKTTRDLTLGEKLPPKEKTVGKHVLALEDLKAVPDELLAWHAWAEDIGPDGKVRRTTSDIFFAEVNPFEEIFREGTSEPGPPGRPQTPADEAAKLQKEIISATWNLRRREQGAQPSAQYVTDAQVIADSQQKAIESLEKMKEKLQSADALTTVAEIEKQMQAALVELAAAVAGNSLPPLDKALPSEQAAYQGLLKLRARETRVMKSRGAPGGGGQSANQQKLDQLELSEEQERYETRSAAANPQETPAQREREEFLNRLRELARRQEDMNQKIKDLQAALEAAKDEEAKKEIERQLKRLRDEQQEMLRDVDQLKNKLDQPEHNDPQAEASKKLEQTREDIRRAADALEKGETSQALNAGTRAESELDKLREDFRKQTSGRFAEEVRDLLDRAEKLDQRQQQIGEELAGKTPHAGKSSQTDKPGGSQKPQPGLRSMGETPTQLAEQAAAQQKELNEVLEQAREITERAEGNEPLLSKQLYDAVREAHQQQTPRAVDMLRQLLENGLPREAAEVEPQARAGVSKLREKIEKAAQGVVGDDVEGLRRAKSEVDRLAQALEEELKRESPANAPSDRSEGAQQSRDAKSPPGWGKPQTGPQGTQQPTDGKQPGEAKETGDGKQPGDKPGEGEGKMSGKGQQPNAGEPGKGKGEGEGKKPGEQPGKGQGNQPGKGQQPSEGEGSETGQGGQPSQSATAQNARSPGLRRGSQGEQGSQPGQGSRPSQGQGSPSDQNTPKQTAERRPSGNPVQPGNRNAGDRNQLGGGPGGGAMAGSDWREWSDTLRNVEEFVPGTRLRTEAARIRDQAQAIRAEAKRHSKTPNWELVREQVYEPLMELQQQLDEELSRRSSSEAAVPLDRDPVPDRFNDAVRRYYRRLGSGQ